MHGNGKCRIKPLGLKKGKENVMLAPRDIKWDKTVEVVVVGYGLAGAVALVATALFLVAPYRCQLLNRFGLSMVFRCRVPGPAAFR